jgi:hypothetical protein
MPQAIGVAVGIVLLIPWVIVLAGAVIGCAGDAVGAGLVTGTGVAVGNGAAVGTGVGATEGDGTGDGVGAYVGVGVAGCPGYVDGKG